MSSGDPAWTRMTESSSKALRTIDKCTNVVKRTMDRVKLHRDVAKAKEKTRVVADEARRAVVQVQESMALMEKYVRLNNGYGSLVSEVASEARRSILTFEKQHEDFVKKVTTIEHEFRHTPDAKADRVRRMEEGEMDELDDQGGLVANDGNRLAVLQEERFAQELHDEIMQERARECNAIAESVTDINEIFKHLNEIVGEQGVQLELIENNASTAEEKTRRGAEELRKAKAHADKSRQRTLIFLMILAIVLIIIVAVFTAK